MKFIADVMLGRLAKRLRLLGFDVIYDRTFDDNELIRLSLEQQRVILTRDLSLTKRPLAKNHIFVENEHVDKQLNEILACISPEEAPPSLTRCSQCNTLLTILSKESAKDLVPDFVYNAHDTFLQCKSCNKVYWQGTHVLRMGRLGEKALH